MLRPVAYLLIVVLFLSKTEMHQLLNVPFLIAHYFEHSHSEHGSLADFLDDHMNHGHDASSSEHCGHTPFDCCNAVHSFFAGELPEAPGLDLLSVETAAPVYTERPSAMPCSVAADFWQPPRA